MSDESIWFPGGVVSSLELGRFIVLAPDHHRRSVDESSVRCREARVLDGDPEVTVIADKSAYWSARPYRNDEIVRVHRGDAVQPSSMLARHPGAAHPTWRCLVQIGQLHRALRLGVDHRQQRSVRG